MQTFAWITGNRELGSYDHRDVAAFKTGLMRLPTTFRFGTLTKGAMARPFHEVILELPRLSPDQRRNNKTINRDLSTMSTVAKHLEQTAWRPKVPDQALQLVRSLPPGSALPGHAERRALTAQILEDVGCQYRWLRERPLGHRQN